MLDYSKPTVTELINKICELEPSYTEQRGKLYSRRTKKQLKKLLRDLKKRKGVKK